MNNLRFFFFSLILTAVFTNCKKDDTITPIQPGAPITKTLKSITSLSPNGGTTYYEWDANNRLTKVTYNDGTFSKYVYDKNTSDVNLYANDPDYHFSGKADMNSNGSFTHVGGELYQEGNTVSYSFDCQYDAKGQLIKSTEKEGDKTNVFEFTWKDGNVASSKEYRNGVYSFFATYTYDTSLLDKTGFDVGHNFIETTGGTTGLRNKNLVTHSKRVRVSNNEVVSDATHTYEIDSEGYVTKKVYADAVYNSNYPLQFNY